MAFGNATIGDLKKIAGGGGGGGGTKDYTQLTNKPSINGVELLGDSAIGKLSGDIKVTLSALDNVNLTSPTNAQTLLFDSLTNTWKNGDSSSDLTFTDIVSDIFNSGVNINSIQHGLLVTADDGTANRRMTGIILVNDIVDNREFVFGYGQAYCNNKFTITDSIVKMTYMTGRQAINVYKF